MKTFILSFIFGLLVGFIYFNIKRIIEIRKKIQKAEYFYTGVVKAYEGMLMARKEYYETKHSERQDSKVALKYCEDFHKLCIETLDLASKEYEEYMKFLPKYKQDEIMEILQSPQYDLIWGQNGSLRFI